MIKAKIEWLKIPSIVNVKRKIMNLIIFSIVKLKKDKFKLDEKYCPNKSFLEKIVAKLSDSFKNVQRKEEKDKIKKKKKIINNLIGKNNTIIELPLSYFDDDLKDIMKYLDFVKENIIELCIFQTLKYYL